MSTNDVLEEMTRWRIAYDTVSALAARITHEHGSSTNGNGEGDAGPARSSPRSAGSEDDAFLTETTTLARPSINDGCCAAVGGIAYDEGNRGSIGDHVGAVTHREVMVPGAGLTSPSHDELAASAAAAAVDVLGDVHQTTVLSDSASAERSTAYAVTTAGYDNSVSPSSISFPSSCGGRTFEPTGDDRSPTADSRIPPPAYDRERSTASSADWTTGEVNEVNVLSMTPLQGDGLEIAGVASSHPGSSETHLMNGEQQRQQQDSPFPFESDTMVELYRRLTDTFYSETFLWMYLNAISRPAARRLRHRLQLLAAASGRSLNQATVNVLTGYLTGYRQSRLALSEHVETALRQLSDNGGLGGFRSQQDRAAWLGRLAVELGVVLNPRQMLRSFSTVVRDLLARTTNAPIVGAGYSYYLGPFNVTRTFNHDLCHSHSASANNSPRHFQHRQHQEQQFQQHHHHHHQMRPSTHLHSSPLFEPSATPDYTDFGIPTNGRQTVDVPLARSHQTRAAHRIQIERHRRHSTSASEDEAAAFGIIPPPPPPYPSFLLHFLTMLAMPMIQTPESLDSSSFVASYSYEALIALGDRLGEVKGRGLTDDDIQRLPVYAYDGRKCGGNDLENEMPPVCDSCVICLERFGSGQLLRVLPCRHEYHAKCVDRWLQINCTCPVCRFEVTPESFMPASFV